VRVRPTTLLAILLLLSRADAQALAADLYVIANPAVTLSEKDIKEVYLGERQFHGSTKLHPVDNAAAHAVFLSRVLQMTGTRYSASWTKKSFRDALNPPDIKAGDAEVLDFVKQIPGAVGYVTTVPTGVTVIQKY
jgi:hypothetical protein